MMLRLDLFQTLARGRHVLPVFLCLVSLQAFAPQLLDVAFDFALQITSLFVDNTDCRDESLPGSFLQMKASDFRGNFETRTRQFAPVAQQFLRTFASRSFQLFSEFLELLQPSLVEPANIVKTLDRPLQILFTAILVLLGLHLIRESHDVADVERTGS